WPAPQAASSRPLERDHNPPARSQPRADTNSGAKKTDETRVSWHAPRSTDRAKAGSAIFSANPRDRPRAKRPLSDKRPLAGQLSGPPGLVRADDIGFSARILELASLGTPREQGGHPR